MIEALILIGEALEEKAGRPIIAVLSLLAPMAELLGSFISKLQAIVDALMGKLAALLEGPGALGDLRDTVQALVDRLKNLNLDCLTLSIGAVFDNLRGKLEAISPAVLGASIDQAFAAMLDTLRIDLLIPPAQIAQLDTAYQHILDGLAALDPEKLVLKVVEPEFETIIIPLLVVFDPKDVLDALYARLNGIEDELRAEMARVNEAYQKIRDAVPSISIDIDIDIDIDVNLPF